MKLKKFNAWSPAGLGITNSGKLQIPHVAIGGVAAATHPTNSHYGIPKVKVGDYMAATSNGFLTPKTVGTVTSIEDLGDISKSFGLSVKFKTITGVDDSTWHRHAYKLTEAQYLEVVAAMSKPLKKPVVPPAI